MGNSGLAVSSWSIPHVFFGTFTKRDHYFLRPTRRIRIEKGKSKDRFSIIRDIFNEFPHELNAFTKKYGFVGEVSTCSIPRIALYDAFRKLSVPWNTTMRSIPIEKGGLRNAFQ